MTSPFDNLAGPGKALRAESPDANEFAGLQRMGLARLQDAQKPDLAIESGLTWPTTLRTRYASRRCAGMATARPTDSLFFNCCPTRSAWAPRCGAFCPSAMTPATWASTKACSKSIHDSSPT